MSTLQPDLNQEINFGRFAAKEGLISSEDLLAVLREYKVERDNGSQIGLAELMVGKGLIDQSEAHKLQEFIHSELVNLIEGYQVEYKLGEGGMGMVYKAIQTSMGRTVALKVLSPRFAGDKQFVDRFLREARASGTLNHPNIVHGFDSGMSNDRYYLAMEFVDGHTVENYIAQMGRFDEEKALGVLKGVASALQHAHELGIVHRDIKPENILISSQNEVKLADLGLARKQDDLNITQVGLAIGTPNYISPEQAKAESDIDIRADLYSLGCTGFYMVTGEVPFNGASYEVLLTQHVIEVPRSVRALSPNLSQNFDDLITKLMAKSREDRYQTPQELLKDIEAIQSGNNINKEEKDLAIMNRLRGERVVAEPKVMKDGKVSLPWKFSTNKDSVESVQKKYEANSVVYYEGVGGDTIFHLIKGEVEILKAGKLIKKLKGGRHSYFGDMSVIKKLKRDATARTTKKSVIVELSYKDYMRIVRKSQRLWKKVIDKLGSSIKDREDKLDKEKHQIETAAEFLSTLLDLHYNSHVEGRANNEFYREITNLIDSYSVREWVNKNKKEG